MVDGVIEKNFPADSLVPKNETGAFAYLTKYPEYNGDGITIAIFDSGVDPRAAGLQVNAIGRGYVLLLGFVLCLDIKPAWVCVACVCRNTLV